VNRGGQESVLFQVNDSPAMSALGFHFEEAYAENGGHQPLS